MKYPYDKGFRKVAFNMPFIGWMCKMTHKPLKRMVDRMKPPKGISLRNFTIPGYQGESIDVKEIMPENPSDAAILFLHGGGFGYKTSPGQFKFACEYALGLNCRAFMPDYHLLPDYPFPAAYEDAILTYQYIIENAAKLGIDENKIIVLGDSAGGALAANVCNTAEARGLPRPMCQVLIYPVTDDKMNTESMMRFTDTPLWNAKNNRKMWPMYLKDVTEEARQIAVPVKNSLPQSLPPTYIETAEFDCLHDEGIAYAKYIEGVAECVEINETKGTFHGYDILSNHPITRDSVKKRIAFMKSIMDNARKT